MKKFHSAIPNRIKAIYLTWVGIHLTLFLLSGNFLLKQRSAFFPFRAHWSHNFFDIDVYDIKEFIFYLIIPIIIYTIIKLWNQNDKNENESNVKKKEKSENNSVKLDHCDNCDSYTYLMWTVFQANVSFLFERTAYIYDGNFCKICIRRIFFKATGKTLYGTWWGIVGGFLGPVIIVTNISQFVKGMYNLRKSKTKNIITDK